MGVSYARFSGMVVGLSLLASASQADSLLLEGGRFDEGYRDTLQRGLKLPSWKQPLAGVPIVVGGNARLSYNRAELFELEDGVRYEELFLQRYYAHIDWYMGPRSRVFLQLGYTDELKANIEPSPRDENNLELHQGIYQYWTPELNLRLGKQEVALGEEHLFSDREGSNVTRTHLAAWGQYQAGEHHFTFLSGSPTDNMRGSWEDEVNYDERYYHLGWQYRDLGLGYYFYENSDPFVGEGKAYRNMLTLLLENELFSWELRSQLFLQWGHSADKDIRAWRYSGDLVRELGDDAELVLALDVASGGSSDSKIKTFDPMYMSGSLLSELSSFTASNLITFHPYIEFEMDHGIELKLESSFYWRYSDDDTLYNPGRRRALSADLDDAFVGAAVALEAEWELNEQLELELTLGRLFFVDDLVDQGIDHSGEIEIVVTYSF